MKVCAVILNHNNYVELNRCVKALFASILPKKVSLEILIVDTDYDLNNQIRLYNHNRIIFENISGNLGVSKGFNIGFKKALKLRVDYILMVTPSIIIEKDVIKKLLATIDDPKVAMVSSKLLTPGNPPKIFFMGGKIDPISKSSIHVNLGKIDRKSFNKLVKSEFLNCPILIKKEVFEKVGFFDERFFMYYEDTDWHLRVRRAGYVLLVENNAISWLKKAVDPNTANYLKDYYITRNLLLFINKNFTLPEKAKAYSLRIREILILFKNYILNKDDKRRNYYKLIGYLDFIKGEFGHRRIP